MPYLSSSFCSDILYLWFTGIGRLMLWNFEDSKYGGIIFDKCSQVGMFCSFTEEGVLVIRP